jgi:hypothetical protein
MIAVVEGVRVVHKHGASAGRRRGKSLNSIFRFVGPHSWQPELCCHTKL